MRTDSTVFKKTALLALALTFGATLAVVAFAAVSQIPLFLVSNSQPNVMILFDNSWSMNTIMQHGDYNPDGKTTYSGYFSSTEQYYRQERKGDGTYEILAGSRSISGDSNGYYTAPNGVKIKLPFPSDPTYQGALWDGNYLNWLFYHASVSQRQAISEDSRLQKTRIQAARGVVGNLVKSTSGIRFGLAKFRGNVFDSDGAIKVKDCGALDATNVDATVNAIKGETATPLGEALAEIWHYFKGGLSPYDNSVTYTSPITTSCQKNYTIILTDGEPTNDACYKGDFQSYKCSNDTTANTSTHLSDVAAYMSTNNIHKVDTYTIGFAIDSDLLRSSATAMVDTNGDGIQDTSGYFTAFSEDVLMAALQRVIDEISSQVSSGSAVTVNSANLRTDSTLYRAKFDSADWSGSLEAFRLHETTGAIIGYPNSPQWEAGGKLKARTTPRDIYTAGTVSGVYQRLDFTTANQPAIALAGFPNYSSAWIGYVRGDSSPANYRQRTAKLGDMVNSTPVISGPPDATYRDHNYSAFRQTYSSRQSLVLVGANDGMLHAFNANTGEEQWSFIPKSLLGKLKLLRKIPFVHTNYVNGAITIGDAYIKSKNPSGVSDSSAAWHTIAVCGLREGEKSFFALDITDPASPIPLWEIDSSAYSNLGYSFATPLILKLRDKSQTEGFRWVAVLANGYEGGAGDTASLLVVDLATGAVVKEIADKGTAPNGLATPAAIDKDRDGYADYLYAGDLNGRLLKFDLSSDNSATWKAERLFQATDPADVAQPITTSPDVVIRHGYQYVFFGTGKYYEAGDRTSTQTQSFYGVKDNNTTKNLTRSDLTRQTVATVSSGAARYRVSSDNPIGTNMGWYINLPEVGERVITDPIVSSRKVIFTTFTPATASCSSGGTSWLMEVFLDTGGTVIKPVFDVTGDGRITAGDTLIYGGGARLPTGLYLGDGLAAVPAIVGAGGGIEYKYIGIGGSISKLVEGGATNQFGLRSWRQTK